MYTKTDMISFGRAVGRSRWQGQVAGAGCRGSGQKQMAGAYGRRLEKLVKILPGKQEHDNF